MTDEEILNALYAVLDSEEAHAVLDPLDMESSFSGWLLSASEYGGLYSTSLLDDLKYLWVFPHIIRYCRENITPTMPAWDAWQAFEEGYL